MRSTAAVLLVSGLVMAGPSAAECIIDNRGQSASTAGECDSDGTASGSRGPGAVTNNGVGNLRRQVELQTSAGVYLRAQDGDAAEIVVGATHAAGTSVFAGSSYGGAIFECPDNNCPDGTDAQARSLADTIWQEVHGGP